jgi:hypothetical protein
MIIDIHTLKLNDIVAYNLVKASWLQKSIRRGDSITAKSIAQLYLDDNQEKGLYRKLLVFLTEDVGLGTPNGFLVIKDKPILEQVELVSKMEKNRECDRFLLAVKNNYDLLKTNPELKEEVDTLNSILDLAKIFYENKRLKQNKENLKKAILKLTENKSDFLKEITILTLENYFLLTKYDSFGARTALAFIVLINLRNIEPNNNIPTFDNIPPKILSIVDDYALDKHTPFGKMLDRGNDFWITSGSLLTNKVYYPSMLLSNGSEKYPYSITDKKLLFKLSGFKK